MSKSWSEVIESIDLSTKQLREPRKLSCDEIADLKEKCNLKYDLTILDLICTIEALQQENQQLRDTLHDAKCEIYNMPCLCYGDRKCDRCKTIEDIDKVLGGKKDV